MNNKKLLYFVVNYAPYNIVTTFRNLKLSKYLAVHNFKQYIFTGDYTKNINLKLNKDIPENAQIYRKKIYFPEFDSLNAFNVKKSIFSKLRYILKDLFFSPDKYIWWVIFYLPKMISVIKKENIKIVMIGGCPYSSFVGGYILKKICKILLILDFHDPWKSMPINLRQSFIRRFSDSFWEKKCVKYADLIIVCTDDVAKELQNNYYPTGKIIKIANGFDYDDFKEKIDNFSPKTNKRFTFLYTGKYDLKFDDYNPEYLIKAYNDFTNKYNVTDCDLILVGLTDEKTKNFIKSFNNLSIKCYDLIPKDKVLELQSHADVLVHFYYPKTHTDTISLKICEYAICNKPIISFNVKEGALYNFIREKKIGETADTNNIDEMIDLFYKAYKKQIPICENPLEQLKDYNLEYISSLLAIEIDDLLKVSKK